jgi:hypothetical protein
MIALLVSILFSNSVQEGDRWTMERTMRFVQESDHVDVKRIDKVSYQVLQAGTELTAISCEMTPVGSIDTKPVKKVISFKPNGFLISREDESDDNVERINRMEWTATEARQGISWSRDWRASGGLLEATVTVKPTSRAAQDTTMLVTYKEGTNAKCVATIKVFNNVRIVEDLGATINNVIVPGATKLGSLVVTEKLKEIHLVERHVEVLSTEF